MRQEETQVLQGVEMGQVHQVQILLQEILLQVQVQGQVRLPQIPVQEEDLLLQVVLDTSQVISFYRLSMLHPLGFIYSLN